MSDPTAPGGAAPPRHAKTYRLTAAGLVPAYEPAADPAPAAPAVAPSGVGPAFPHDTPDQE